MGDEIETEPTLDGLAEDERPDVFAYFFA